QAAAFFDAFLPLVKGHDRDDIAIFPSITSLATALDKTNGSNVTVGAQNMHWLDEGAYTGETSPTQLLAMGCNHILLGHSELRQHFGETSERVNMKLKAAIAHKLTPIVCVGESLDEREANQTAQILREQMGIALLDIQAADAANLVIAYEPIWAIGTGLTARPEMCRDAHRILRDELAKHLGNDVAESTRILYGGSVKPDNIDSLMSQEGIDGALVGGASLHAEGFSKIVRYTV
ncbi:MAG: triose-phosphate isomerase, partial [Bryocella sp.]